jgi:hypothetical protein
VKRHGKENLRSVESILGGGAANGEAAGFEGVAGVPRLNAPNPPVHVSVPMTLTLHKPTPYRNQLLGLV